MRALDLETNTVTPLLKRLQTLGYVSRERDTVDERKVTIVLTDQGRGLREQAVAMRSDFVDRIGMPYEKLSEMRASLHELCAWIDDLMPPAQVS